MDLLEARARGFAEGSRHPWERARLALVRSLIGAHVGLRPGDTVLDVGCGDTFVVEQLARAYPGVQFYAVDSAFTDDLLDAFRARLGVSNVQLARSLDDVHLTRPASLVLLMDVIEHVSDDVAFLRDVCGRAAVDRSTSVLITVPAYPRLFGAHDRFLGHYRRYSRRSLNALLGEAGLASNHAGHLFATLLPARVLQLVRERVFRTPDGPTALASWTGAEVTARALSGLLVLEGRMALLLSRVGVDVPGLSAFAICRKSAS
jgi:hypothetical protein